MSESELVRDLVQEGIRQAMQLEALKSIRFLINTAWFAIIVTPVVLALILWRVWYRRTKAAGSVSFRGHRLSEDQAPFRIIMPDACLFPFKIILR
jgi:heme/copper-type cytochrome/quinol oxidase subunit 2